ncbi:MAG: hypothetical protein RLN76_12945 [Phycisphaeraceae bacterium]
MPRPPRKPRRFRLLAAILGLILGTWAAGCYQQVRWADLTTQPQPAPMPD